MIYMTYILLGTSIPITFMTLTMILARFFFLGTRGRVITVWLALVVFDEVGL